MQLRSGNRAAFAVLLSWGLLVLAGCKSSGPQSLGLLRLCSRSVCPVEPITPQIRSEPCSIDETGCLADKKDPSAVACSKAAEPTAEKTSEIPADHQQRERIVARPVSVNQSKSIDWSPSASDMETAISEAQFPLGIAVDPIDPLTDPPPADDQSWREGIELNLPSALAMIGGDHPVVGIAQWRVREAYAQLEQAQVLWLPTIQSGLTFHRLNGNLQNAAGQILDVNRNSFQYGLGTGANAAGPTMNPGLLAQFHLADAIFQPRVTQGISRARGHAANAVINSQLLEVASAYVQLVEAYQDRQILEDSQSRAAGLSKITNDFAEAGQGLRADAQRVHAELMLIENRLAGAEERIGVSSARLAQALSLQLGLAIRPLDVTAVPLELISTDSDAGGLIETGLVSRPELKEAQALVAAACEAYRREQMAPFVPSVLLGFSVTGFGGGNFNNLSNVGDRVDFDALATWQVRNFGLGEKAARRESSARIQQARFESLRVMDEIAREVSEAYHQVNFRRQQIGITRRAIESAEGSYRLNLDRIREGQGLPLEVLQSVQALEDARRAYLRGVIDYNQAQLRLQWALGWPSSYLP